MKTPDDLMSARDYNRVCAACLNGRECSQPYEALDGTVYECKRIVRPT